jgi:uncharacterized membrane protein YphA (DoxX/SURF4 family)
MKTILDRLFDPHSDAPKGAFWIRFMAGWVFLWEGIIKFQFANQGVGRFTKLGLPMPEVLAPAIATLEIVGGLMFIAGFLTRPIALVFIGEMVVAILSTKVPMYLGTNPLPLPPAPPIQGFWAVLHESRADMAQLLCSLFLLLHGPGPWSLDAWRAANPSSEKALSRYAALVLLFLALPSLALRAADTAAAAPMATPAAQPYAAATQIDLDDILAPPPGPAETRKELDALLAIQKKRSPEDAAACIADQVISVYRFADVLGDRFSADKLPKTDALFLRVLATVHVPLEKAQKLWGRKRPPLLEPAIKPAGTLPTTAAYPSGHATAGNLMGILLADLLPERSAELHARGVLFGDRRVLAGVHYPSDIEAGKLSAAAIAAILYQDPQFKADFAAAATELRGALGLRALSQEGDVAPAGQQEKSEY